MSPPSKDKQLSRLQEILHLPPLPGVAAELLREVTNEEVDIPHLTAVINKDPGLAARIVGIANSAYFARQREIHSVEDAIVRVLGLNMVRGLAVGIALSKPFDVAACPDFEVERYWYRAFVTANLAARVGTYLDMVDEQRHCLFLAGLLHNLGQLILVHAFPSRMAEVFRLLQEEPHESLISLQSRTLAVTEDDAGKLIVQTWKLPRCVGHTIQFRHEPNMAGNYELFVRTVVRCARMAEDLYDGVDSTWTPAEFGQDLPSLTQAVLDDILEQARANDEAVRGLAGTLTRQD